MLHDSAGIRVFIPEAVTAPCRMTRMLHEKEGQAPVIRASLKETDLARVQAGLVAEVVAEPRLYRVADCAGDADQGPYVAGHLLIPFKKLPRPKASSRPWLSSAMRISTMIRIP